MNLLPLFLQTTFVLSRHVPPQYCRPRPGSVVVFPIIDGFAHEHTSHGERDEASGGQHRQQPERGLIRVFGDVGVEIIVVDGFHLGMIVIGNLIIQDPSHSHICEFERERENKRAMGGV